MKHLLKQTLLTVLCTTFLSYCDGGSGLQFGIPAQANTISTSVRRVSITEATGQSGASPPKIELSFGYGVNISFILVGEIVEKVWLDNPSFATLDVDGCLVGLGGNGSKEQSRESQCQQNGAKVLHLRRINPVSFPGLPKTDNTLLTVVTSSDSGQRLYLFRVATGSDKPQYHTIEIVPNYRAVVNNDYRSIINSNSNWQVFARGLTVATSKGLVRQEQPLYTRIQNFIRLVQAGKEIEFAASTSGISMDLVKRLNELGRADNSTFNSVPAPTTVPNLSEISTRKLQA